jgi:hypothetical protein
VKGLSNSFVKSGAHVQAGTRYTPAILRQDQQLNASLATRTGRWEFVSSLTGKKGGADQMGGGLGLGAQIECQVSSVKCQVSSVKCQVSSVKCKR